jgi:hypothetical protein
MPHLPNFDAVRLLTSLGLARASDGKLIPGPMNVAAKTAAYTILPSDPNGSLFTNRGAVASVTFTLPAVTAVPSGTFYWFIGIAAQNMIVAAATADTLVTRDDVAADSIAIQTANGIIGSAIKLVNDGTQWIALGETVGATYTVVTA